MNKCLRTWKHSEKLAKHCQFDDMHINESYSPSYVINYLHLPCMIDPGSWPTSSCINMHWSHPVRHTPRFDHSTGSGVQGEVKVELCCKVALLAVPVHFSSVHWEFTPCSYVCFSPHKVLEDMPSSSKKWRCVEYWIYLLTVQHIFHAKTICLCKSKQSSYFEGASVTGFAHKTIKKEGKER